jgi:hypothetical protein
MLKTIQTHNCQRIHNIKSFILLGKRSFETMLDWGADDALYVCVCCWCSSCFDAKREPDFRAQMKNINVKQRHTHHTHTSTNRVWTPHFEDSNICGVLCGIIDWYLNIVVIQVGQYSSRIVVYSLVYFSSFETHPENKQKEICIKIYIFLRKIYYTSYSNTRS